MDEHRAVEQGIAEAELHQLQHHRKPDSGQCRQQPSLFDDELHPGESMQHNALVQAWMRTSTRRWMRSAAARPSSSRIQTSTTRASEKFAGSTGMIWFWSTFVLMRSTVP